MNLKGQRLITQILDNCEAEVYPREESFVDFEDNDRKTQYQIEDTHFVDIYTSGLPNMVLNQLFETNYLVLTEQHAGVEPNPDEPVLLHKTTTHTGDGFMLTFEDLAHEI